MANLIEIDNSIEKRYAANSPFRRILEANRLDKNFFSRAVHRYVEEARTPGGGLGFSQENAEDVTARIAEAIKLILRGADDSASESIDYPYFAAVLRTYLEYPGERRHLVSLRGFTIKSPTASVSTILDGLDCPECKLVFERMKLPDVFRLRECRLRELQFNKCSVNRIDMFAIRLEFLEVSHCGGIYGEALAIEAEEAQIAREFHTTLNSEGAWINANRAFVGQTLLIRTGSGGKAALLAEQAEIGRDLEIVCPRNGANSAVSVMLKEAIIRRSLKITGGELLAPTDPLLLRWSELLGAKLEEITPLVGFNLRAAQVDQFRFADISSAFFEDRPQKNSADAIDEFEVRRIIPPSQAVNSQEPEEPRHDAPNFFLSFLKLGSETNNRVTRASPGTGNYTMIARALRRSGYKRLSDDIIIALSRERRKGSGNWTLRFWIFLISSLILYYLVKLGREDPSLEIIPLPDVSTTSFNIYRETFLLVVLVLGAIVFLVRRNGRNSPFFENTELIFQVFYQWLFRFGFSPLRSVALLACFTLVGGLFFILAEANGIMAPTAGEVYHLEHQLFAIDHMRDQLHASAPAKAATKLHLKALSFHRTACFPGLPHEDSIDRFSKIPLVSFYKACRLNWANPNMVPDPEWTKIVTKGLWRIDETARVEFDGLAKNADRNCICEIFLPAEHSKFSPFIYALDITIPLLDLRQEDEWGPRGSLPNTGKISILGYAVVFAESVLILFGWLMAIVFAAAITGLSDPTRRQY